MTDYSDKLAIRQSALVILVPEADPLVAAYRQRYDPSAA
ncbi:2'-5' RNA ligase family protein, partial [Candidatus Parcubacteria bacterium]